MDIMRRPRLGVQVFTNPEVRVYHATTRLADNRHYGIIVFGRDRHYEESDELSDRDKHLIDTLYDVYPWGERRRPRAVQREHR